LSSLEYRCAGSSDCGGVLVYIEPMYRGPCIGTIYLTLLGFGGIQAIILSYNMFAGLSYSDVVNHVMYHEFMISGLFHNISDGVGMRMCNSWRNSSNWFYLLRGN